MKCGFGCMLKEGEDLEDHFNRVHDSYDDGPSEEVILEEQATHEFDKEQAGQMKRTDRQLAEDIAHRLTFGAKGDGCYGGCGKLTYNESGFCDECITEGS